MMKKAVQIIFLLAVLSEAAYSQISDVAQLEKQIKHSIANAQGACVRIYGYDTVKKTQNSGQFSGVVVSGDGTILTVSHAMRPKSIYKVLFPDGREALATGMGRMGIPEDRNRPDLGMLKILTKGNWPFAEMGWSYSLKINEPCISIAYPATVNLLQPTIRFGRIVNILNSSKFIESSCKMEPGDSGGALLDYMGRVIGLHNGCMDDVNINWEVPIDTYRKYWSSLKIDMDYNPLPTHTDQIGVDPHTGSILSYPILSDLAKNLFSPKGLSNCCVVKVFLKKDTKEDFVYATAIKYGKQNYLIGKSSIIPDDITVENGDKRIMGSVMVRDQAMDLVLISVSAKLARALDLKNIQEPINLRNEGLGTFLFSPLIANQKIGVLGNYMFRSVKRFSLGYVGAGLTFKDGVAEVVKIATDSPAFSAGLEEGDFILTINEGKITGPQIYSQEIGKCEVGDTISMNVERRGEMKKIKLALAKAPRTNDPAENFDGGRSTRMDGFERVFAHDMAIKPWECGGPVFDYSGKFYGINIARFSRTTTLVMPTEELYKFVKNYFSVAPSEIEFKN